MSALVEELGRVEGMAYETAQAVRSRAHSRVEGMWLQMAGANRYTVDEVARHGVSYVVGMLDVLRRDVAQQPLVPAERAIQATALLPRYAILYMNSFVFSKVHNHWSCDIG